MIAGQLLLAYHGCDITTRDDLVSGRIATLDPSRNSYDWLGPGAYFFEGDCERAVMFAHASFSNPEKMYTAKPIGTPAVVGVVLRVQNWLDMTTQEGINEFDMAYRGMLTGMAALGTPIPENRAAGEDDTDVILRRLDNAVFTFMHHIRANNDPPLPPFQAVRGAFPQGTEVAPKSGFRNATHVQIALRDPACVEGWFLVKGQYLLSNQEYGAAVARRDAMGLMRKPRKRPPVWAIGVDEVVLALMIVTACLWMKRISTPTIHHEEFVVSSMAIKPAPSPAPAPPATASHARGCSRTSLRMAASRRRTPAVPACRKSGSGYQARAGCSARPPLSRAACRESDW